MYLVHKNKHLHPQNENNPSGIIKTYIGLIQSSFLFFPLLLAPSSVSDRSQSSLRTGGSVLISSCTRPNWITFLPPSLTVRCGAVSGEVIAASRCGLSVPAATPRSEQRTSARCWWCARAAAPSASRCSRHAVLLRCSALSRTCSCACGAALPPRDSTRFTHRRHTLRCPPPLAPRTTARRCFPLETSTTRPACST